MIWSATPYGRTLQGQSWEWKIIIIIIIIIIVNIIIIKIIITPSRWYDLLLHMEGGHCRGNLGSGRWRPSFRSVVRTTSLSEHHNHDQSQNDHSHIHTRCRIKLSFTDQSISKLDLTLRGTRPWKSIFFLLRLGRIKRSLVTSTGKYGHTAPNFSHDFWAKFISSQEAISA